MNPLLRDRVLRRLDVMSDERAYEILDYIEFLESKYAQRPLLATSFQRFAEGIEDTLRAGRLPATFERLLRRSGVKISLGGEGHDQLRPAELAAQMGRPENEAMRRSNRRAVADADLLTFATAVLAAK